MRRIIVLCLFCLMAMGCRAGIGGGGSAIVETYYPDEWRKGGDPYRSRQASSATSTSTTNRPGLPMVKGGE